MQANEIDSERAEFLKRVDKLPEAPSEPVVAIYDDAIDSPLLTIHQQLIECRSPLFCATYALIHVLANNGISPTNRQVAVRGCTVSEVRDGRFAKSSTCSDQLALLQQLGVSIGKAAAAG
jgi:hypothetical protein